MESWMLPVAVLVSWGTCVASAYDCRGNPDGFYKDERHCETREYYHCLNRVSSKKTCSPDTYVDKRYYSSLPTCMSGVCTRSGVFTCTGKTDGFYVDNVYHCQTRAYFECKGGKPTLAGRCEAGFSFDDSKKQCVEGGYCKTQSWYDCTGKQEGGWFINKDHCQTRKYYRCVAGLSEGYVCDQGKYYDRIKGFCAQGDCKPPTDFDCTGKSSGRFYVKKDHCQTRKYYLCSFGVTSESECEQGKWFDFKKSACVGGDCPTPDTSGNDPGVVCPANKIGIIVKSDHCKTRRWYSCAMGMLTEAVCPVGEFFSKLTGKCVTGPCVGKGNGLRATVWIWIPVLLVATALLKLVD